jgi:hypothetical protein
MQEIQPSTRHPLMGFRQKHLGLLASFGLPRKQFAVLISSSAPLQPLLTLAKMLLSLQ